MELATDGAERMDRDGTRAARGRIIPELLGRLLDDPYYRLMPPKSTGKELFNATYVSEALRGADYDLDDVVATLCELTAATVADACRVHNLDEVVVAGGGIRNPVLMARLAALVSPTEIRLMDDEGLPAQGKEAYLFALLGFLSVHGLVGTVPSATGAREGSVLGSFTPGATPLRLPEPIGVSPTRLKITRP